MAQVFCLFSAALAGQYSSLLFANQEMDGHVGSAPTIPVWKTDVCLSTLMPEEMESRAGVAPT